MSARARWHPTHLLRPSGVVAIAVIGSIAARSLTERLADPDLWWHLRTGELIATTRSIPTEDVYSYTAAGRAWTVQEWGAELILHGIREAFGLWGILMFRTMLLVAIYAIVARIIVRRLGGGLGAWALVALTAYAGAPNWTERPNLLSFLLFALTLTLIDREEPRALWWFVPISFVWANLHGMVLVGLGLMAVVAVGESIKIVLSSENADRPWVRRLWQVLGLGALVTLINPRGPGLYAHALGLVGEVRDVVTEWASPNFHQAGTWAWLLLLLITVAVLALGARRPDATDLLLVLAFTFLALQAVRNLAIAGIVLGVVVARNAPAAAQTLRRGPPAAIRHETSTSVPLGVVAIAVVVAALGIVVSEGYPASKADRDLIDPEYPIEAIDALAIPGARVFAYDVWAPMVIDRAWPDARVFFDLRSDMYGTEGVTRYAETIAALPGWDDNLDDSCTTHVLIRERDPLNQVLSLSPGWEQVASDEVSVTWVRSAPPEGC